MILIDERLHTQKQESPLDFTSRAILLTQHSSIYVYNNITAKLFYAISISITVVHGELKAEFILCFQRA